jgi:hypothetical protein
MKEPMKKKLIGVCTVAVGRVCALLEIAVIEFNGRRCEKKKKQKQ